MPKRKKSKLPLILFIILIVIIAGVAAMYFYTQINNDILGKNQSDDTYTLVIEKKDFEYEVGQKLANNKIVCSDVVWTNWMSNHYPDFEYTNGEYNMTASMSYEEIAEEMGRSEKSVDNAIQRLKKKLKKVEKSVDTQGAL